MIPSGVYRILGEVLPTVILFSIVAILLKLSMVLFGKEKWNLKKNLKYFIYIIYVFILFQLVTTTDFTSVSNNFVPFKEIFRYEITSPLFYRNVIGNILLFVPFAFLISDTIYERIKRNNFFINVSIVLVTSIATEVIQSHIGRSFDIDDIILNFIGGVIGFILFTCLKKYIYRGENNESV